MDFSIRKLDKKEWEDFSESAHKICFNEIKPKEWDRIDYALLVINEKEEPCGYMTCKEIDSKSIFWQYGGGFKPVLETIYSMKAYQALMYWHKERYDRIGTYIENTNSKMLKMAAKIGFKITGIRNYNNQILLEHLLEFGGK